MTEATALAPDAEAPALTAASYKSDYKPIWCPGCGDYTVLNAVLKAMAQTGRPPHEIAVVSGIGCSSRIPAYTSCYGFHGVHGRSLAAATGLKVARPDLTVLVASGDGDGYSIGGNHFLHACRRNVDMTYMVMDNHVYGMTKGQPSPTTEPDWDSKLSPGGTGLRVFHPLVVALASGANFVARAFAGDQNGTADILAQAMAHPGFSFVEILSPCVTFRPEQRGWKDVVRPAPVKPTSNPEQAARRLMTDDGINIGVLYLGNRPAFALPERRASQTPQDLEAEFAL
ncbi:2-oxoacid:ferredoxin oxidoreductase subunit beta [Ottowia sp.]|uniref:2-oxoacid:ferredoxin oxidoreductase subunit beta n=1 Tax=Ottowia sp. TaxID=1898956 RepID=UPI002BFF3E85|nr:2-oxoacid:ferredoxin oxidoreductase subunit beta [Ottowia sp.]HRN75004.1 2-oxoacid:ferredoxin oxidoreductase subunit beta [Ottowia sp.]HRQ02108.1 2-oxoacid:ferredoxin oxidoreductase subunit beta [Ottowia sp.]